jgi:hypothetical protein
MITPFEASKLKLERVAEHLQDFDRGAIAYLNSNPWAIVVEPLPGGLYEQMGINLGMSESESQCRRDSL